MDEVAANADVDDNDNGARPIGPLFTDNNDDDGGGGGGNDVDDASNNSENDTGPNDLRSAFIIRGGLPLLILLAAACIPFNAPLLLDADTAA